MDSNDTNLLIEEAETSTARTFYNNSILQYIHDGDMEKIIYGYRSIRWRVILTYIFSILFGGLPFLVFHWYPTWFLYLTSVQCTFVEADLVLLVEIYQKKCKENFIHKILKKNINDIDGLSNEGYQDDAGDQKITQEDLFTNIYLGDGTKLKIQEISYFCHKKVTLVWDGARAQWMRLAGVDSGAICSELHRMGTVQHSEKSRGQMLRIYGRNEINVPMQSIMALILLEIFNPFYVFQFFTIAVWIAEQYYYYCIAIVIMSALGVTTSVVQTRKNQNNLRATVEAHDLVDVYVSGGLVSVPSTDVCPGDVVSLPQHGCRMQFDAVLLTGSAIVNEAMLTGESMPVTKTSLPPVDRLYDQKADSSHTLYCGTQVIQTRMFNGEPVRALVLRTGYDTSKGQLVRSILYPMPADFKFDQDSYKFIIILSVIATIGLIYTIVLKASRLLSASDITLKALDILTIVIPPALPAAMTVGRLHAVSRLKAAKVACLNTRAVNVSGSIDCFCFDKTGTLTEEGLDMWGVVPVKENVFLSPVRDPSSLYPTADLLQGMASCHSLTLLDGELAGDPLDLKMFESTNWVLEEPGLIEQSKYDCLTPTITKPKEMVYNDIDNLKIPIELGIVMQNQFVSSLQRASVVTMGLGEKNFKLFCKGAPEAIANLCVPDSVPSDLNLVLSSYAEKGYRVIAMSSKQIDVTYDNLIRMKRDELERDLVFHGLIILENRLKNVTKGVINELKEANIHIVMITGDNIHTAVSVAKECGILEPNIRLIHMDFNLDENTKRPILYCDNTYQGLPVGRRYTIRQSLSESDLRPISPRNESVESCINKPNYKIAMNGDTWKVLREYYPELLGRVIERGAVFARMTSEQKQQLIIEYQALGYYVGMCGDGANDCGALRTAHTGVSLSELESSVAAPFTSQKPDISCSIDVLREGRAALSTSFGIFHFMIGYSLAEFFSVALLYYFDSNLTDFQFLYIDIALIVNFATLFGYTKAYNGKLYEKPPLTSLLSIIPLTSLIGQFLLVAITQFFAYYAITLYPWFIPHTYAGDEDNACWENYAVFSVSMFQYIILIIVVSHGAPYRKSIVTNVQLMISIVIMTALSIYVAIWPADWVQNTLELFLPLEISMSYIILVIAAIHFCLALFFERFVIQHLMERKECIPKFLKEREVNKTPHLVLKRELKSSDYLEYEEVVLIDNENVRG